MPSFGSSNQELSKANWGWSWMDRWIAARPWESRVDSPKIPQPTKKAVKNIISPTSKAPVKVKSISPNGVKAKSISPNGVKVKPISPNEVKVKSISPNGKVSRKARKLSYEAVAVKKTSMDSEAKKTKTAKESS